MDYVGRYAITSEKLNQQYVGGDLASTQLSNFPSWLGARAEKLAGATNDYLTDLRGDLALPAVISSEDTSDRAYNSE